MRRLKFADGSTALERVLTSTETEFTYQVWNIQTRSGRFIDHIYGVFKTVPVEGGTELQWSYNIKPKYFFARPFIRSFLRNDFKPFMEGALTGWQANVNGATAS